MAGVFIKQGMRLQIPAGGLIISTDQNTPSSLVLHVHFDVCPTWCEIAIAHVAAARSYEEARNAAWQGSDEDEKAKSLELEFSSSMQAIMAAAIAVDAFYAVIQSNVNLPQQLVDQWRTKRTARYSQVTEVLRRGFHLKRNGTKDLRQNLKELYRFRDLAVHPSGKIQASVLHPDLNVGVEWRFAFFRAGNARLLVDVATAMIWDLAFNGKVTDAAIIDHLKGLRPRLAALFPSGHPRVKTRAAVGHGAPPVATTAIIPTPSGS